MLVVFILKRLTGSSIIWRPEFDACGRSETVAQSDHQFVTLGQKMRRKSALMEQQLS